MIDALEMYNDHTRNFINLKTGDIVTLNFLNGDEFSDFDDEVEEGDEWIPDHYIPLPEKWDLNKYGIMSDFCDTFEDVDIYNNLMHAIRGNGAFGRFKTAIYAYGIQDDWYKFQHARLKKIAVNFCKEHNLSYRY